MNVVTPNHLPPELSPNRKKNFNFPHVSSSSPSVSAVSSAPDIEIGKRIIGKIDAARLKRIIGIHAASAGQTAIISETGTHTITAPETTIHTVTVTPNSKTTITFFVLLIFNTRNLTTY
jgi:hypothetical protein